MTTNHCVQQTVGNSESVNPKKYLREKLSSEFSGQEWGMGHIVNLDIIDIIQREVWIYF
jgi:hypothetical protein